MAFSLLTYLLFVFGPLDFPMAKDLRLAVAVGVFNLAMYLGYRAGISTGGERTETKRVITGRDLDRLMNIAFTVTAVTLIPRLVIATQNYSLDPNAFIAKIATGLAEAQTTYSDRFVSQPPGIWQFINYACVLTGFVNWLYPPLVILLWPRISWIKRGLAVLVCLGAIAASISRGQNFGAFDVLIQLAAFGLIRATIVSPVNSRGGISGVVKAGVLLGAILTAMSTFFANTMRSRIGDQYGSILYVGGQWINLKESGVMWILTPEPLRPLLASLTSYVVHGYAALAMSFDLPFNTTFGFGSSYFLLQQGERLLGVDLLTSTYQYKLSVAENYDGYVFWHTAYLWIANDVSIVGVPVVLFALFFLFGRAWRDFVLHSNVIAALLMANMAIFTTFVSANNQLAGNPNALFGLVAVLAGWLFYSRKFEWDLELLRSSVKN